MAEILIYKDRESFFKDKDHFQEIRCLFPRTEILDRNIEFLYKKIYFDEVRIFIIFVHTKMSQELKSFLEEHRNHINLRKALILLVHSKWEAFEAQQMMMLGVGYMLEEPLSIEYLQKIIVHHISGRSLEVKPAFHWLKKPIPCRVDTFGRIVSLEKDPPGDLIAETNISWSQEDHVSLHHVLALDIKQKTFNYQVFNKSDHGLNHHYAYRYYLSWQKDSEIEDSYQAWVDTHKAEFIPPKLKVLFILNQEHPNNREIFGRELFDSHVIHAEDLNVSFIQKLDPQVVIKEILSENKENIVAEWSASADIKPLILAEEKLVLLQKEEEKLLHDRILQEIEPFLREKIKQSIEKSFYIDVHSKYSRFTTSIDAFIMAISRHHVLLQSPLSLAVGASLQVHLEGREPIFLYVTSSEKSASEKWDIIADICYLSEGHRGILLNENVIEPEPLFPSAEERVKGINKSRSPLFIVLSLLVLIGLLLIIASFISPKDQIIQKVHSGLEYNENYQNFATSVKKSFSGKERYPKK